MFSIRYCLLATLLSKCLDVDVDFQDAKILLENLLPVSIHKNYYLVHDTGYYEITSQ